MNLLTRFLLAVTKAFVFFRLEPFHPAIDSFTFPLHQWDPGESVGWDEEEEGQICFKGGNQSLIHQLGV